MAKSEINLVILSPSSEVNKLTFSSISTATTVGELRARIAAAVATHPAPARQRLIYRGHALVDPNRTLKDIFSQEIIDSSDTLSLHLVLPPEPRVQLGAPAASSNDHNNSIRSHSPRRTHQGPGNVDGSQNTQQGPLLPPPQRSVGPDTNGPPQTTAEHGQTQHIHVHTTLNGHFPPQIQQAFAQIQAVNQQLAAQLSAAGSNPGLQGIGPTQFQAQPSQQSYLTQPFLQNLAVPQPQQLRAAGGQVNPVTYSQQPHLGGQAGNSAVQGHSQGLSRPSASQNINTGIRDSHRANGERPHTQVPGDQGNVNPSQGFPTLPPPHGHQLPHSIQAQGSHLQQNPPSRESLLHLQSSLTAVEVAVAGGNPLSESVFQQLGQMLQDAPDLSPDGRLSMETRLNSLAVRATRLRENLYNNFSRAAQGRAAAQRTTQGTQSSAVYVLSSPIGPQALLVSPAGLFTSPWQIPGLATISPHSFLHHSQEPPLQPQSSYPQHLADSQQPSGSAVSAQQAGPQQVDGAGVAQVQPEQRQQQQMNQVRDLLRILLPLGGHLWLLIRLFGFVYFFTAGAGWRRAILLGLVASLVFIAQTGIFRPVIQAIWDPIRRHAEGLVPLAGNEDHAAGADAAGGNTNPPTGNEQLANRGPTPQEAAARLLDERERQDINVLRQGIRRVERAIALFIASLVPGVGERHIAAREAAEAARQAEVREREQRAQREEEDARKRQEEHVPADAGLELGPNNTGEVAQSSIGPQSENRAPPPLIEI